MIYDAHIHAIGNEKGGFIIGLEGVPCYKGTLSNEGALALHNPEKNYISFYYVTNEEKEEIIIHKYLKYHPRREGYTPEQVVESIKINKPKAVIIDTLNEPYWTAYDYWNVAKSAPKINFIFAHAGGYLINDFIKICHFQPNVWIDFALTHTTLGKLGDQDGLEYISDAIHYSLRSPFKNRVLLSSDYPFFNQEDVFEYYKKDIELLNSNFEYLLNIIK